MNYKIGNSTLVEKFTRLTELFPANESLQHDLLQLQSVENKKPDYDSLNRNCSTKKAVTIWSWIVHAIKMVRFYADESVNKLLYRFWNSQQPIERILDECLECCKVINLIATQLFEFRKQIGTRIIHPTEEQFLHSTHAVLLSCSKFLESHLSDEEVSLYLTAKNIEKRFNFSTEKMNLNIDGLDKNNIFTVIKYVEQLLNLSELAACTTIEFGFRIAYSEMMRTHYQSYCSYSYFSNLYTELSYLRSDIQDSWDEFKKFLSDENKKTSELESYESVPIANKFSREYKLWKNAIEMNETGNEIVHIFDAIATSAVELLKKDIAQDSESDNGFSSNNYESPKDCQLYIQTLMNDSNVMLAKLIRLSSVNEGIVSGMLKAKSNVPKISTHRIESCTASKEATNVIDESEITDRDGAPKSIYEHGQDESDINSTDKNVLDHSEKFEVYQLQERTESDDEMENKEKSNEWEPNVSEVKATHNFVMSELKQVLVGVKDIMSKRENEAFVKKYGASFAEELNCASKHDLAKEEFSDGSNSSEEDYQSDSALRRRILSAKSPNWKDYSDNEKNNIFKPTSNESQINLMMCRPNFAPLRDEYTIDDTGSEPESDCDEN